MADVLLLKFTTTTMKTICPTNSAADYSPKNMPEIVKNDTPVERE